jgi:hypothetical protein
MGPKESCVVGILGCIPFSGGLIVILIYVFRFFPITDWEMSYGVNVGYFIIIATTSILLCYTVFALMVGLGWDASNCLQVSTASDSQSVVTDRSGSSIYSESDGIPLESLTRRYYNFSNI